MAHEMVMVPTRDFDALMDRYKEQIGGSTLMNKASRLAAERNVILHDRSIPDALALTMTRPKARELNKLTRRIRRGVGNITAGSRDLDDGDDDDMVHAPLENALRQIIKSTQPKKPVPVAKKKRRITTLTTPLTRHSSPKTPLPTPPSSGSLIPRRLRPAPKTAPLPTKKRQSFGQAIKEGALDGLCKTFGTPKGARANVDTKPGWEDFVDGKKTKRTLFQDAEASKRHRGPPRKAKKAQDFPPWRS